MELELINTWEGPAAGQSEQWPAIWQKAAQGPLKAVAGWNGVVIWDPEVSPVDLARAYLEKTRDESCGVCTPCRVGTDRLCRIMDKICDGRGSPEDLELIKELAEMITASSRCDIGLSLGKPLFDLLEGYAEEFNRVIEQGLKVPRGQYQTGVTAPCISACPSNVDIPGYIEAIGRGEYAQALEIVRRDCPMPGTIGRVCVRPCEGNCRRGIMDQPMAIKHLKRFVADWEMAKAGEPLVKPGPAQDARVAVVGAGPAGLSCAYYLGLMGYRATIFEKQEGPGGMAAYGIPNYRLPFDVLNYEVSVVEQAGAEIRYGVDVGNDVTLEQLGQQGYGAIFVGVGAPEASSMRCQGEDAGYQCFMTGVEFLAQAARGQRPLEGDSMLVIGGGNVAMDCVRTARRLGFSDVNLLYRRTGAEMPADPVEIDEAQEEGVKFHYLVAPIQILAEGGKVTGLECQRMELGEPDASGRRRPVPIEGSEFVIKTDAIIPAVGQICVVDCVLPDAEALTPWKTLVVDEMTFQSKDAPIFGGGDCVTGPATLIAALAAGKKAARYIAQYLQGGQCHPTAEDALKALVRHMGVWDPHEPTAVQGFSHKAHPAVMDPDQRVQNFDEVEGVFSEAQARAEAARCLRCYRPVVAAI